MKIRKIPTYQAKSHPSIEGLVGFLMEHNIIPDKNNPLYVKSKALKAYVDVDGPVEELNTRL